MDILAHRTRIYPSGTSNSIRFILGPARLWIALLLLAPTALYGQEADPAPPALRADGRLEFLCPESPVRAAIRIEIADYPAARARGLTGRLLKDDAEGMLFVYDVPAIQKFWMRDTPGSLDMIFAAEDGRVLNIAEQTVPLSDRAYSSSGPARYAQTKGDRLVFDDCQAMNRIRGGDCRAKDFERLGGW